MPLKLKGDIMRKAAALSLTVTLHAPFPSRGAAYRLHPRLAGSQRGAVDNVADFVVAVVSDNLVTT